MTARPEQHLQSFWEGPLDDSSIMEAEQYLVNVMKSVSNKNVKTFDQLRRIEFGKGNSPFNLSPTSHSIVKGHIPRWYFLVKENSNIINPDYHPLNPLEFGWKLVNDELYPVKHLNELLEGLSKTCSCKSGCKGRQCGCKKVGGHCSEFCKCVVNGGSCINGHPDNKTISASSSDHII